MDNPKKRTQIKQESDELHDQAADSLGGQVKLSHFDHRKHKPGKRENLVTSSKLETVEQSNSEQPLDNDSLGG